VAPPPIGSNLAELALADRARSGDALALAELYRRHGGGLHRHAARMLRDEAAARDVVQESFLRAITSMPRTRAELHFRAWVFRIATNLCLRELTQRSRAVEGEHVERQPAEVETAGADRGALRENRARAVEQALAALPDRQRQILLLREVEELSYEELAEVLGLSLGNVKVSLHRARRCFACELFARQLLENGASLEGATCEVGRALSTPSRRRELVRHLEGCDRCRAGVRSSLPELLALSPPLAALEPPASLEQLALGARQAPGATGAAGASAGAGLGGWGIAIGIGAIVCAVAAVAAGAALLRDRGEPSSSPALEAHQPSPSAAAAVAAAAHESLATRAPGAPVTGAARVRERDHDRRSAVKRLPERGRRRSRATASASPRVVPQVGDTEDAP
jgi:RNA polymerase sigma-70 factor (ECF subfamily)